jgi:hypothetical protein
MTEKYLIYALIDPRTETVRYVGKSTTGLRRANSHANEGSLSRCANLHKVHWIRDLQSHGLSYRIAILDMLPGPVGLSEMEQYWIARGRSSGWQLVNLTNGGDGVGGWKPSPETIAKWKVSSTGRRHTEEAKRKISAAKKGVPKPYMAERNRRPDIISRVRSKNIGRRHTLEARKNMGLSHIGTVASELTRTKMRSAHLGLKHTPEAKRKIRDALVRYWSSGGSKQLRMFS